MYIQHIPGWNEGAKIRKGTWLHGYNWIYYNAEFGEWYNQDGVRYELHSSCLLDNDWEPVKQCPHCGGTGVDHTNPIPKEPIGYEVTWEIIDAVDKTVNKIVKKPTKKKGKKRGR